MLLFLLLGRMAALPSSDLLTLNMLSPGVKYQIYNRSDTLVGTGVLRTTTLMHGNLVGIFSGITTGIGAAGFMPNERILDNFYYRFRPAAIGGYKKLRRKTRKHKVAKKTKKSRYFKRY